MKKNVISMVLTGVLAVSLFAGCGNGNNATANNTAEEGTVAESETNAEESDFDMTELISVYSREDGSGTRGAFIELFGVEQKDESGEKVDYTTEEAVITNSTDVMLTSVANDTYGIGYVSLGSLNSTVKTVKIDGAEPTVENIKNGTYKIARPFNIATSGEVSDVAKDFINYIMSVEGQQIITEKGFIASDNAEPFVPNGAEGKIVVGGSSSVAPVMEKLIEAYKKLNVGAEIELQSSDSTIGMTGTADGTLDIGMASRALKDSEIEAGLTSTKIAMDGIAVIVNQENPIEDLNSEIVQGIFTGELINWDEVN